MRKSLLPVMLMVLMMTGFVNSAPVAEYCAEILTDSTYRPLLIKDLDEAITEWNYPKTVPCPVNPCTESYRPKWEMKAKLDFPHDIGCVNGQLDGRVCRKSNKRELRLNDTLYLHQVAVNRIEKRSLLGSTVVGPNYCVRNQWALRNVRETLKNFYGKTFEGEWIAEHGVLEPMKYDFGAKLVGECTDSIPSIEYCIAGDKEVELHLVNSFENLPKIAFADINDEERTMYCEGMTRVEKSLEMDFGKNGKRMLTHFVEQDTCQGTGIVKKEVYLPIPKYVSAASLKRIPKKSLYGKNIPVISKNVLTCNFDVVEKNVRFSARIVGECDERHLQEKSLNPFKWMQVEDVRIYGQSIGGRWDDEETEDAHLSKCVEMKVLRK